MKQIILVSNLFLVLAACNYSQSKSLQLDGIDSGLTAEQVDFKVIMDQVLTAKCLTCHSNATGNRGGLNLENYQNVAGNLEVIRERVADLSMPPRNAPALTESQLQLLMNWIDDGAPEQADLTQPPVQQPTPPPAPVTPEEPLPLEPPVAVEPPVAPVEPPVQTPPVVEPTPAPTNYEMVFKQVIQPSCLKCHSNPGADEVNLDTYQDLLSVKDDVRRTIADGSMPRRSKLTDDQKKLILDWLDAGAPQ